MTPPATQVEPYKRGRSSPAARTRGETLLWSALLASSNDSATALAIDAGGGSLAGFYALANAKARALGMTATTYASASGLDDVRNLSTAMDQAILARAALQNPTFASMVGDPDALDEVGGADAREALGEPQQDARDDARHVRRQDRLDEPGRGLPDRRAAPRRSRR